MMDVAQVDGFARFDSEFLADLRNSLGARGVIDHPVCCAQDQRWNCQPSFRIANQLCFMVGGINGARAVPQQTGGGP